MHFAGDEAQRAARSTCTTQACTSCNSVHDCAIARRCMSLRDCTPALPALPPQDNLMVKDRGPFLFWMLNECAPAAAAAH